MPDCSLVIRGGSVIATVVSGAVTYERGEPADALPGRLLR